MEPVKRIGERVVVPAEPTATPAGAAAAALAAAQGEFAVPRKSHTATVPTKSGGQYTYTYSSLDELIAATRPALVKHGFAVMQPITSTPDSVTVGTVLLHQSGEQFDAGAVTLPVLDGKPQSFGSALTYARRYGMAAALGVAAEEDDDAQTAQRAEKPRAEKPRPAAPTPRVQSAPPPPDDDGMGFPYEDEAQAPPNRMARERPCYATAVREKSGANWAAVFVALSDGRECGIFKNDAGAAEIIPMIHESHRNARSAFWDLQPSRKDPKKLKIAAVVWADEVAL